MSRTKTEDIAVENETAELNVEAIETVDKVTEPVTKGTVEKVTKGPEIAVTAKAAKKSNKMGVEIYLQKNPQPYEIAYLLRSQYKSAVMTYEQWNETLEALMAQKIVS